MARDPAVVTAVRRELAKLPEELRQSGLAAAALTLAKRLDDAAPRDTAGIARELRTTLAELRDIAGKTPDEEDLVNAARDSVSARLSDSDS